MSKFQKFQIGFDVHGDQQDSAANKVFFDFAKIWKPEIRIMGGDLFDFRPLRKGAGAEELREKIGDDLTAGKRWFNRFAPTHFLRGNHCERLWEKAEEDSGLTSELAQKGVEEIKDLVRAHNCRMLPYHKRDGVLRLGNLKILHGFFCGVYAARQHALVYGSCLFGHVHRIDEHSIAGLDRRVARACGALCKLDMDYNSRQPNTLAQSHGFPYGIINKATGKYHVWQAECVDGAWMLPSDFTEL